MEKNIKINKIVFVLLFILFFGGISFSYDEILLYEFYHGDFNSNLKFVDEFRSFYSSPKAFSGYFRISYVSESISQDFDDLSSYTSVNWKATRKLPEKINMIFGNNSMGVNLTLGLFFPVFDREISYEYNGKKHLFSNNVGEGDRYYQLYIYFTPWKFLNIGAAYGRVFGNNTTSTVERTEDNGEITETYSFTSEKLTGVYKYLYFELIPWKALHLFGFIPKNISGSYMITTKNDSGTTSSDYSWYVGIPFIFGGKLDFNRIIFYGNYRFTEKNIYLYDENDTYTFKGVDNTKWNMYELGTSVILNNIFVQLLDLSFGKEKYFILNQNSEVPTLYSLRGALTIVYKNIFLKIDYRYFFGKTEFDFGDESPMTHIKGSRLEFSLSFQL